MQGCRRTRRSTRPGRSNARRELSAEAAKLVPGAESRVEQRHGPIWQTILETADSMDAAVIVVGSRGLSGLRSSLLGSVSHALVNRARRPVLVFPPDESGLRLRYRTEREEAVLTATLLI